MVKSYIDKDTYFVPERVFFALGEAPSARFLGLILKQYLAMDVLEHYLH